MAFLVKLGSYAGTADVRAVLVAAAILGAVLSNAGIGSEALSLQETLYCGNDSCGSGGHSKTYSAAISAIAVAVSVAVVNAETVGTGNVTNCGAELKGGSYLHLETPLITY
jgi:hypothetical protein